MIKPGTDKQGENLMFRRIVISLDTSELAESILPYIQQLGPHQRAEIMLVSVIESSPYGSHLLPTTQLSQPDSFRH